MHLYAFTVKMFVGKENDLTRLALIIFNMEVQGTVFFLEKDALSMPKRKTVINWPIAAFGHCHGLSLMSLMAAMTHGLSH